MLKQVWNSLKVWRKIAFGPVSIVFKFERSVTVTSKPRGNFKAQSNYLFTGHHQSFGSVTLLSKEAKGQENRRVHEENGTAVIVGVGPGFGFALARRLSACGFEVVLVSRNAERLEPLVQEIRSTGGKVASYGCDAAMETSVRTLFAQISKRHGTPNLVVYGVQHSGPGAAVTVEVPAFEDAWRHNCLGAFLVARAAAQAMLARRSGTIVLVGSTSSIVGRAGHLNLAIGKFGQRALAQVMARELWPSGIHVAHLIIDADIQEEGCPSTDGVQADPTDIAESVISLHRQPRSAWTSELDLRPWNEKFWEHC
jgi:NAD(P)-dependent dehydrogenase (short-subunit alcohol dehydrogenase family)